MPPKANSKTPPLTKSNKKKIQELSKLPVCLPPEIVEIISKQLKNVQKNKYDEIRDYMKGQEYFYKNYGKYMKIAKNQGKILSYKPRRYTVPVWVELSYIFPKFPVSCKVKDLAIDTTKPLPGAYYKEPYYNQWSIIRFLLKPERRNLNNNYSKMEGFVDSFLEEMEAELESRFPHRYTK